MQAFSLLAVSQNASFIFFLSPERKPKQKKECKNVLSSEAETQILQITQRTRYAQTAFRISLFRLHSAIRNSMLIQRICIPLKTSSCGMFLSVFFTRQILHSRAVAPRKNIPHEEVFIGCTIIGIVFDSCVA